MMQTGAQKQRILDLDSDQKTILLTFACTLGLTLLCGVIFQNTMTLFVLFPACLLISSAIFRRRNKSTYNGALYVSQNGKTFTTRDCNIYRGLIFVSFFISPFASVFLEGLVSGNNAGLGMFLIIFFPYLISTIYCFIRKIPLSTFVEGNRNRGWSPSESKSPVMAIEESAISYYPNQNNMYGHLFSDQFYGKNHSNNDWCSPSTIISG